MNMLVPVPMPKRPLLRWHGGKWRLAPWIISHFPPHRKYVEPFGGAASVLLRKPRAYAELYNDLDDEVVNLFRILQRPDGAAELERRLRLTPYARQEFLAAYGMPLDDVDRARFLIIRSFMGFGANAHNGAYSTGFRDDSDKSGSTPAHDWARWTGHVAAIVGRLQGVVIEQRDAFQVMARHDRPDALFYIDPPYMHGTRSRENRYCPKHLYAHELTDADHQRLLEAVLGMSGMIIISGYANPLYDGLLAGWERVERPSLADGARPRIEVLWINQAARPSAGPARSEPAGDSVRAPN